MNGKKSPEPHVIERERRVLDMRLAGFTFDQIAQQIGYANAGGAHKAFNRAMIRTLRQPAEELREAELARLDQLQAGLWRRAIGGDARAVDTILRLMDRRARLLGLDAPQKVEAEVTTHAGSDIDKEVERLAQLLDSGSASVVGKEMGETGTTAT